jgi:hypothetical protein
MSFFLWNSQSWRDPECNADVTRERLSATYLLASECALRALTGTLTLGHKALLRLRAHDLQCAAGAIACEACRPIASLWTIEVSQPRLKLPVGVHCGRVKWSHAHVTSARRSTLKADFMLSPTPVAATTSPQRIQRTCHAPFAQPSISACGNPAGARGREHDMARTSGAPRTCHTRLPSGKRLGLSHLAQPTGCTSLQITYAISLRRSSTQQPRSTRITHVSLWLRKSRAGLSRSSSLETCATIYSLGLTSPGTSIRIGYFFVESAS